MKRRRKEAKTLISEVTIFTTMQEVEIIFTDGLQRPKTPEEILMLKEDEVRKAIMKFFDMFIDIFLTPSTPKPRSRRKGRKKGK